MNPFWGRRYYEWLLMINQRFAEAVAADREGVVRQLRSTSTGLLDLSTQMGIVGGNDGLAAYLASIPDDVAESVPGLVADTVDGGGTVYFDWQYADEWSVDANPLSATELQPPGLVVVLHGPFENGPQQAAAST